MKCAFRRLFGDLFARAMRTLPEHKSLVGYMERRTLMHIGRLHVRLHRISSADATPFLHSHPFSYVSIILRGGYTEQTQRGTARHGRGSILWRSSETQHRLASVDEQTLTLFITWQRHDNAWSLMRCPAPVHCPDWIDYPRGVYVRHLYGKRRHCKFDGFWYGAADTPESAWVAMKPSIDQTTPPIPD